MPVFRSGTGEAPAWCELECFEILMLEPGDCVATGMGHHHDFVHVEKTIRGVYFETTLEGKKRRGHLWNHTHGPAEPRWERV